MKSSSVASIVVACSALAALVATSLISSKPSESPVEPVGASKSPVTARARFGEDASSHRAAPAAGSVGDGGEGSLAVSEMDDHPAASSRDSSGTPVVSPQFAEHPLHELYEQDSLHARFLRQLPEPPEGIARGSEAHISWARARKVEAYVQSTRKNVPPLRAEQPPVRPETSDKDNPYTKLSEQGVFSMIPDHIGTDAKDEEELLREYREEKVKQYVGTVQR